ncbi:Ketoreductase azaE [Psilocybe cubensis]|uniref:Ketoreductase azaE n=1 Tax=Psilocybe cubensis TaxID=181762 RepID=A0ACB8HI45_PSICU|nr:Ketoreductase azaE [Psilocybe cubensis]KAH9487422.1 Ketoreductase azaE [Psilocybe cubensis]
MPTVEATENTKVLVTGANGFVAMGIIQELLQQGFSVRGSVRSHEKGMQLKEIFSTYGDKLEYVIEGAFDEAVLGVKAVQHTASPVPGYFPDEDPLEVAHMRPFNGPTVLDENDWGDEYVKIVEERGKEAAIMDKYSASKTLSERAAWDFYEQHKKGVEWDLVVISPSHPLNQNFKTADEVTRSVHYWYEYMFEEQPAEILKATTTYVDVRDIAAAHVEALKKEAAAGQFFLTHKPEYFAKGILKAPLPDLKAEVMFTINSRKAQDILGIKYRSFEETMLSMLAEFEKRCFFD